MFANIAPTVYNYIFTTGYSSVWLERSVRDAEAVCSNHTIPTRKN
ncbi:hypothetical protein DSUL_20068 [Desulfovibrionales bacterium]